MGTDTNNLTLLKVDGPNFEVRIAAKMAAGSRFPATKAFALGMLAELHPPEWQKRELGVLYTSEMEFYKVAMRAIERVDVVSLSKYPEKRKSLPTAVFRAWVADPAWLDGLEINRVVGSRVYPIHIWRSEGALVGEKTSAADCRSFLKSLQPEQILLRERVLTDADWAWIQSALVHPNDEVVFSAMRLLDSLHTFACPIIPLLQELTQDSNPTVATKAVRILGAMGQDSVVDFLVTLLGDQNLAEAACLALGTLGQASELAIEALSRVMAGPAPLSGYAAFALTCTTGSTTAITRFLSDSVAHPPLRNRYSEIPDAVLPVFLERFTEFLGDGKAFDDSTLSLLDTAIRRMGAQAQALRDHSEALYNQRMKAR